MRRTHLSLPVSRSAHTPPPPPITFMSLKDSVSNSKQCILHTTQWGHTQAHLHACYLWLVGWLCKHATLSQQAILPELIVKESGTPNDHDNSRYTHPEEKVTTHEEKVTSHEEKVTSHEEKVTTHEEKVTTHEELVRVAQYCTFVWVPAVRFRAHLYGFTP